MHTKLLALLVFAGVVVLAVAPPGHAASNPEVQCQEGRYAAAAKYSACHLKVVGKHFPFPGGNDEGKCLVKYTKTWTKLQTRATGTGAACDAARFEDNGDGTVSDALTGLQWEKKQNKDSVVNPGDPHDADNKYPWSATGTAADGAVFTDFLASLNTVPCFAGHCDWRLPNLGELQTLLLAAYPLGGIDAIFGPIGGASPNYWSSQSDVTDPDFAWFLSFQDGSTSTASKINAVFYTRAVRGGL